MTNRYRLLAIGVLLSLAISCENERESEIYDSGKPTDEELAVAVTAAGTVVVPTTPCTDYCCAYSNPSWISITPPTPSQAGPGSFAVASTWSRITVDSPYENGTLVYNFPIGYKYTVTFQMRKFGSPLAAQASLFSQTIQATTSWQTHTINSSDYSGGSMHLHTITSGPSGGVEIQSLVVHRLAQETCTQTCKTPPQWESVALTAGLFQLHSGTGSISINGSSQVAFNVTGSGANYILNTDAAYDYELTWSMSYVLDYASGEEAGIYPHTSHEYYSANNCIPPAAPGCVMGNVADNYNGTVTYYPPTQVFTNKTEFVGYGKTNTVLFRISTTNGGSITISNFALKRKKKVC